MSRRFHARRTRPQVDEVLGAAILEHLEGADAAIFYTRLLSLPPEQLASIYGYLDSGKPILAIRTANHGFIDWDYRVDGKRVPFGEGVLGGSFRGHHGNCLLHQAAKAGSPPRAWQID